MGVTFGLPLGSAQPALFRFAFTSYFSSLRAASPFVISQYFIPCRAALSLGASRYFIISTKTPFELKMITAWRSAASGARATLQSATTDARRSSVCSAVLCRPERLLLQSSDPSLNLLQCGVECRLSESVPTEEI